MSEATARVQWLGPAGQRLLFGAYAWFVTVAPVLASCSGAVRVTWATAPSTSVWCRRIMSRVQGALRRVLVAAPRT